MKISKREPQIIGDYDDEDPLRLCPNCLEHGFMGVLGPRLLLPNETKTTDWDQFITCNSCYTVVPLHEAKTESQIDEFVETIDNPFKQDSGITGLDNKKRKTDRERQREKQLEEANQIPDSEISAIARSGIKVEYEDTNPEFCKVEDSSNTRKLRKDLYNVVKDAFDDY